MVMGLGFWAQRVESEIFGGGGLQERGGGWFWLGRWGSGYNLGQAAKYGLLLWCNLQTFYANGGRSWFGWCDNDSAASATFDSTPSFSVLPF